MGKKRKWPVSFVIITKAAVMRDGPFAGQANKLRIPGNNGRKIFAINHRQAPPYFEHLITEDESAWLPPAVVTTCQDGLEVATFTEFSGHDRHRHARSTEIYTVLKGVMNIYLNDQGPYALAAGDEIVVLPGTVHQVCEQIPRSDLPEGEFDLLVRVHAINCYGELDKYVQLDPQGEWKKWSNLTPEERKSAFKK